MRATNRHDLHRAWIRARLVALIALVLPLAAFIMPITVLAVPIPTGMSPTSGSVAGGTLVTITGIGFVAGATVTFDGIAASAVQFVSSTQITCQSPPHTFGAVSVRVTNPDMTTGGLARQFIYTSSGYSSSIAIEGFLFRIPAGSQPRGITAGPDGNVWFTEYNTDKIARMTPAGGFTEFDTTTPSSGPTAIATGPDGNIWFVEALSAGNRVGRMTTAGAIVNLQALSAFASPSAITAGPDGKMWFTEPGIGRIGKITTGSPQNLIEIPLPHLDCQPFDIVTGPDGNLWFTEHFASRIGRITTNGVVTEFPLPTGSRAYGITLGPDGNLWFTEDANNKIGRITPAGVVTEFSAGLTAGSKPMEITAGPDGRLWFTEFDGNGIGNITLSGTITDDALGGNSHPFGIAAGADNTIWFTESGSDLAEHVIPPDPFIPNNLALQGSVSGGTTITITGTGFSPDATIELGGAATVPLSRSDTQIVARTLPHTAGKLNVTVRNGDGRSISSANAYTVSGMTYSANPTVQEFTVSGDPGSSAVGIVTGPDGNLWTAIDGARAINRITPAGVVTPFGTGNATVPYGIAAGPDGNLWFTEIVGNRIGVMNTAGAVSFFPALPTANSNPLEIVLGPDSNLWFTEGLGNRIGRITPSGTVTEFPILSINSHPHGITAGPDGNLWFTETSTDKIGRITPNGTVTEFSSGITANSEPYGITAGPDGNLWFTEHSGDRIGKITTSGAVTEYSTGLTPSCEPTGIVAGADGNLWFVEQQFNKVGKITTSGTITEFSIATVSERAEDITVGPDGNLWFSKALGNKVDLLFVAPPRITTLSKLNGPVNAATPITITGSSFAPNATVTFGGTPATNVTIVNPTTITCITPVKPPGTVQVVVTNPGPLATTFYSYTYGTPNVLPNPEPSGGSPGSPNPLPNGRASGFVSITTPGALPPPRP